MQRGFVRCCRKKETAFGNEMAVVLVKFFYDCFASGIVVLGHRRIEKPMNGKAV